MASLDLDWIAVFDEIYKTANVSRAAERLDITQGAASTALNRLRSYFDDPLFSRTTRGMMPTPRAQALHPILRAVREGMESAREGLGAFVPAQAQRTFRICMTDISEVVLLPVLMNHLRLAAPRVTVDVEKISPESPRRLEDGEVDLAVGFMPQLDAGFYQQVLFGQNFVCIVAASHPRIGQRMTKAAFAREQHVAVSTPGTGHAIVDRLLARAGVKRHIGLRVPSFLGVAAIVANTELIAIVPSHFAAMMHRREKIRILSTPHALPAYDVKQHWHERFHSDPGNAWLRRTMAQLLAPGSSAFHA
ncbi:LysR family transcriptional regulator [Variovorax sp. JS1663]|uniref:LysR family transcriptional regulator n=1 Tax=Variovorax sp. JS1663 TaxID=1851577 RepID=UPI000B3490D1|nr:LysR family transcriptional regulator [Variovorax sp. JS1663]OUL97974.1 LysR family transcriptional regulator [Variovorax sp. JS1663]